MLDRAKEKGIVEHYGSMLDLFQQIKSVREIPLFHGDQWEITVPSLLGIDQEDQNSKSKTKLDPSKLLKMDSKDVVQKAQQERCTTEPPPYPGPSTKPSPQPSPLALPVTLPLTLHP